MIFQIPREVPSQNVRERWHWSKQRREVKSWAGAFLARMRPGDRATKPREVIIQAYRKRRISDFANLVGGCKGMVDGLVSAGLLVDDSTEWVRIQYFQDVAKNHPTGLPCTMITVIDMK
jgi:hypothetical protein